MTSEVTLNQGSPVNPTGSHSYLLYYFSNNGIHRLNTNTNIDSLLIPLDNSRIQKRISPDKTKIALTYTEGDSSKLVVIDVSSSNIWHIKSIPQNINIDAKYFTYSFEWSPDSKNLGVGYYSEKKSGKTYSLDKGDIFIVDFEGKHKRSVGCSSSKIFKHWLDSENIVVSNRKNLYIVDVNNCHTLFAIPTKNKTNITFSPTNDKMFYTESTPVYYRDKGRTINVPELYLADYNGKNPKKLVPYRYAPKRPKWSSDGKIIAFDVKSQEWINIRYISLYFLETGKSRIYAEEELLGLPSCEDAYWAPNSNNISFNKSYERGDNNWAWTIDHKVIKNIITDMTTIISEGRTDFNNYANSKGVGGTLGWIDKNNIMFATKDWIKIYNRISDTSITLTADRDIIYVKEISR